MRKESKQSISKIQRLIWVECRRIKDKSVVDCYTCGAKNLMGSNKQLGHLWSKATLSAFLKYDLRVLEWQCFRCNINGGGMGADFYLKKWEELGSKRMKQLQKDRQVSLKAMDWYINLLEEYKML